MLGERNDKPLLVFRRNPQNRFSLPPILGRLEEEGLRRQFRILLAHSAQEIVRHAHAEHMIIGFSFMTPQLMETKRDVERLRRSLAQESLFLAGGSHATGDPEGTLHLGFDYVFAGEAERTFPDFLRDYLEGKVPRQRIIAGEKNSSLFASCAPYALTERFFAPLEITRGCLYRCDFCQTPRIFGQHLRHRSAARVSAYLRQGRSYGYRERKFLSANAFSYGSKDRRNPNLAAIEELFLACREAGEGGIYFGCYPSEVRPDWVNPEVLRLVRRYCRNKTIVLGAQSGSDALLKSLHRRHTSAQALTAARWIREAGFLPHVDFVFGFPEETLEDRSLSLELIEKMIRQCGARIHAHTYLPLPGTPLFSKEPSRLDGETKNLLKKWEKQGKLDGWWQEQEEVAWEVMAWRDQGLIRDRGTSAR